MPNISNFFHCTADNIGDIMSGPGQHIWPAQTESLQVADPGRPTPNAVIGGGQIFSQLAALVEIITTRSPLAKVVAWGVGLPPMGTRDRAVMRVAEKFAAFGTRNYDWRDQLTFVPCASCLSPLFDSPAPPRHDVVVYAHRKKTGPIGVPEGIPMMTNSSRQPQEAIDFIASGETVVTSSYHGVYWAQLLGRKVICLPYNNKFDTLQHTPTMAEAENWQVHLASASRISPMLEEYRALNREFARRVMEIWNG